MSKTAEVFRGLQGLLFLAAVLMASCQPSARADRVFVNAHVLTMNDSPATATAFAIRDGSIVAVGSTEQIVHDFPGAPQEDLQGKTVMPGIVESHVHLLSLGQSLIELNIEGIKTPEQAVEKVRERAAKARAGEWITGWGWDEGAWARNYPSNHELSRAAPNNPVWLRGLHGFAGWANARAMLAGAPLRT